VESPLAYRSKMLKKSSSVGNKTSSFFVTEQQLEKPSLIPMEGATLNATQLKKDIA